MSIRKMVLQGMYLFHIKVNKQSHYGFSECLELQRNSKNYVFISFTHFTVQKNIYFKMVKQLEM